VHVWRVHLAELGDWDGREELTADERERAARFRFEADRRRLSVTRAILRKLLGLYLEAKPAGLRFECNPFGKPALVPEQNHREMRFNVAHSGDCSLLAFALSTYLGVDVEDLRLPRNIADLAPTVLSSSEYKSFLTLPHAERKRAFCEAWTRKEAVAKALGGGLSIPHAGLASAGRPEWVVRNLKPGDPYTGAIAVKARHVALHLWMWSCPQRPMWKKIDE
jgi:4'-phosphopantetheinyl transferase